MSIREVIKESMKDIVRGAYTDPEILIDSDGKKVMLASFYSKEDIRSVIVHNMKLEFYEDVDYLLLDIHDITLKDE